MSIHHLYPKARGGTNYDVNRFEMDDKQHINHHRVFQDLPPIQQLIKIFNLNNKILSSDFRSEMRNILEGGNEQWYYKDGVYRK